MLRCRYLIILIATLLSSTACRGPSHYRETVAPDAVAGELQLLVWPATDDSSPLPHCIFGEPRFNQEDPSHTVLRHYGAFTVYYDDRVLGPRWAAIKLTQSMVDANSQCKRPTKFLTDNFLSRNGFAFTDHDDYTNLPDEKRKWDRGHMVQFDDARGYGEEAAKDSMYTTNICPQLSELNEKGWLALEQRMTQFARDCGCVWILVGPIYGENPQPFASGRRVPAPVAFYRIAIRRGDSGTVEAVSFIMPQAPVPRNVDLQKFVCPIREIERRTGLDFLHELPDRLEQDVESRCGPIWSHLSQN